MKNDEGHKSRDPYKPEETPKPPHVMEPNKEGEREAGRSGGSAPASEDTRAQQKPDNEAGTVDEEKEVNTEGRTRNHLLSDDADIDDETTI